MRWSLEMGSYVTVGIKPDFYFSEFRGSREEPGCAGGVGNCINWVFLTMAGPFMRTWAGCGLYIPEKSWFTGRKEKGTARRRGAGIPLGTPFSTKPEIARKLFRTLPENSLKFNSPA